MKYETETTTMTTMTTMTTKRSTNGTMRLWAAAAALAAATALGAGCRSDGERDAHVDDSADLAEHNRLLVRLALAENVYNGIAAERAVYPKDFDPASAQLNRLGAQRVATLADASRSGNSTAPVVVVRGDAPNALYASRVETVRRELIAAGMNADAVAVAMDTHVGGGSVTSDRALLTYKRLVTDFSATTGGSGAGMGVGGPGSNGSRSK